MRRGMRRTAGLAAAIAAIAALPATADAAKLPSTRIDFRAGLGDEATIYDADGLRLKAKCTPDGIGGQGAVQLRAISGFDNAMIHANGQNPGSGTDYFEDNDFDKGQKLRIEPYDNGIGQLVYARPPQPGKRVRIVAADYLVEDARNQSDPYDGRRKCAVVGTARTTETRATKVVLQAATGSASADYEMGFIAPELSFNCASNVLDAEVIATSNNGVVHANSQFFGDPNDAFAYSWNDAFDELTGDELQLPAGDGGVGQLVFARADGALFTLDYLVEDSNPVTPNGTEPWGGTWGCGIAGLGKPARAGSEAAIDYRAVDTSFDPETIFKDSGLTLKASCDGELEVTARSKPQDAMLHTGIQGDSDVDANDYKLPEVFSDGETVSVFDADLFPTSTAGQLVYSTPKGTHVSIDFLSAFGSPFGGSTDCAFAGVAQVSKP